MQVMIVVTHLLGTGHLARALVLAKALDAAGHRVQVISGGMPAPHLDTAALPFVQLPPLRSDGANFTRLLDETGADATQPLFERRQAALLQALESARPNVLITELFPFGRRVLNAEFGTLLDAANKMAPRPLICASVRDILAPPSKPEKAAATEALVSAFYDTVLVHSDPAVVPLEASWPVTKTLAQKLHYTGFVAQASAGPHPQRMGSGRIIVSAGGGNVGAPLYAAALAAAECDAGLHWHLLVGGHDAKAKSAALQAQAPHNVIVEPARPEFRQMLSHARASVSLCGYNTALDVLQTGIAALFVPFDEGGEVEQTLRANALQKLDAIRVLKTENLTGARLLSDIRALLKAPRRAPVTRGMDGAAQTVSILADLAGKRAHAH